MNNEETIIMQPQSNNKAQQSQNVNTSNQEKKSGNGKNIAAMTGAAVFGGAAGGAGTAAAANTFFQEQVEEEGQTVDQEIASSTEETPATTAKSEPKAEIKNEEVEVITEANAELDYTGNAGADPVVEETISETEVQPLGYEDETTPEVQVLGVYQDEEGMEAAILTNGEEIAAVVDIDGDGYADALLVDENHNDQIEENEIYDVTDESVEMSQFEEAYLAQQEQMQQEQDTFAYNVDDQQDYNNDAPDLSFA